MEYMVKPIGEVFSKLKNLEDCPRQEREGAPEAAIRIFPDFVEGVKNINQGDKLILFTIN